MNIIKHHQAIFSNSPSHLLAKLAEDLFSQYQHPFTKRWILVANRETEHWLRKELIQAASNQTFMGSTIFSSSDSLVKHLFFDVCQEKISMPDHRLTPLSIHELFTQRILTTPTPYSTPPSYQTAQTMGQVFRTLYTFAHPPSESTSFHTHIFSSLYKNASPLPDIFASILSALRSSHEHNCSLHIFCCSHLPRHIADFFSHLSAFFPVSFYCFSPSQEYFGDLLSDKAIDFLWKQLAGHPHLEAWEHYALADRQALLANLSHKSQIYQNFFIDKEIDCQDLYLPPEEDSTLGKIQRDIFHLTSPTAPTTPDSTLTISQAANISREVHATFDTISKLIHQGTSPKEIFILSPRIDEYQTYLKAIFQPHLPLYFTYAESTQATSLKEKLLLTSSFIQTKGNLYSLLQILSHPHVFPNQKFLFQSLSEEWKQIPYHHPQPIQALADRILNGYPFIGQDGQIDQTELWEKILPLLYSLQNLLNLYHDSLNKTYTNHAETIFSFLEQTFSLSSEEHTYIADLKTTLLPGYASLSCSLTFFSDFCLDFFSHFYCSSPFYDKPGPYVGSLKSLSFLPKGHTFILGANHSTPTIDLLDLLDTHPNREEILFSSSENEENFHFLQTLMSTRHSLHISYLSTPNHPATPSDFVIHLLEHTPLTVTTLPSKPYIPSLFLEKKQMHSSQAYAYKMAQSLTKSKIPLPSLFTPTTPVSQPQHVSLNELVSCICSPLDFFLKTNYNIPSLLPRAWAAQEQLFPTQNHLFTFWENTLLSKTKIEHNYLSNFSKETFNAYHTLVTEWIDNVCAHPHTRPHTCIFSSRLFHDEGEDIHPSLPLQIENQIIHIQAIIPGVFEKGVYLFSMDPKPSKKKRNPPFDSMFTIKNFLKAQLSLAMLIETGVLDKEATIHTTSGEELSPCFSSPQDYLYTALNIYHMMQIHPIPLITTECWKALDNANSFHKTISDALDKEKHNPQTKLFWQLHNREHNLSITEEQRLLILSLFKEPCETL